MWVTLSLWLRKSRAKFRTTREEFTSVNLLNPHCQMADTRIWCCLNGKLSSNMHYCPTIQDPNGKYKWKTDRVEKCTSYSQSTYKKKMQNPNKSRACKLGLFF
jgi:hypothetical protein